MSNLSNIDNILTPEKFRKLEELRKAAWSRERFLKKMLWGTYTGRLVIEPERMAESDDVHFIIARKWNSWYPSYFDTEGGCYAFLLPKMERSGTFDSAKPVAIVVDPGFKFLETLRRFGLDISDIGAIIVSHYHMDHMAGLAEFLTLVHEREQTATCRLFLNETTFNFYKDLQTKNVEFCQLKPNETRLLARYTRNDKLLEYLYLRPFACHHKEMGSYSNSLGLSFEIMVKESVSDEFPLGSAKIGILGDTDGCSENISEYLQDLGGSDVAVLHLGTVSQGKVEKQYGSGEGHLYDIGIVKMLSKMKEDKRFTNLKSVVISEFGLEMTQICNLVRFLRRFDAPNEWGLFLNLAHSLEVWSHKPTMKEHENDEELLKLEMHVFGILCDEFLLSKKWLSEISRVKVELCLLLGYLCYIRDPDQIRNLHIAHSKVLERFLPTGLSAGTYELSDSEKTMEDMKQKLHSIVTTDMRKFANSLVTLLLKVCSDANKDELLQNLKTLLKHIAHQALIQMMTKDFLRISSKAVKISHSVAGIYPGVATEQFKRLTQLMQVPVCFSSLCSTMSLIDEINKGLGCLSDEANSNYADIQIDDPPFFSRLTEILADLVPVGRSLLIGDEGFHAKLLFDRDTKRIKTLLCAESELRPVDYEPIQEVQSVESGCGKVTYRIK